MTTASWHVRISYGGQTLGAGFLVTDRHVLTCAHVVARADADAFRVTFAHGPTDVHGDGRDGIPARVVRHGGWSGRATDPGDLAVLELDRPVSVEPARFAAPSAAYGEPPRRLYVYGFPKRYDEGTLAEYRATADQLIAGEWVQLEAWTPHGQPLAPGFSGAAVTLADSGLVVGMVSAAAHSPEIRNGRMLPAQVMARYWPPLGELIPTPGHTRREKQQLREFVAAMSREEELECRPEGLYRDAVGALGPPLPAKGFRDLWDAAWYLLSEVPDSTAAARFAARLADFVEDARLRGALRSWPGRPRPGTRGPVAGASPWSPILVEIAPSGSGDDRFLVEVSVYAGGNRRLVGSRTLPVDGVQGYAQECVDEAYRDLTEDDRELIAFALPRRRLNTDVAHWRRSATDESPLGSFAPVVVLDLERRRSGALQHKLAQKWRLLDDRPVARMHRIGCGSVGQDPVRLTVGLRHGADMVGFGIPPRADGARKLFEASLNAAVPVLLWPRSACRGGPDHQDCPGARFLDRLAEQLAELPPSELPSRIHELRMQSYLPDAPQARWADDLALLWEDPRCLPEPTGYQHSPVR
ncbi:VMAP-C domain-containing protein [Streptomyces cylindrosporus]|uniref:Serine protease n=1 Tax=Streptomyces cylindrosporus TaxID=2927583 RepID=A0ABS9XY75_9ACTN|nr:trypsin-like peptidase domain-containing protein [Streptomyces cylindrosporus]MCI3269900.1 serine protease [Streptomyces cylindrosporus]